MSVYKEGYSILREYEANKTQIWNDSCDEGVLCRKDGKAWNKMKQLVDWYGEPKTRKVLGTGNQVQIEVTLIDEWAVSDERKTVKEATEVYTVLYFKFRKGDIGSLINKLNIYDGFYSITRKN